MKQVVNRYKLVFHRYWLFGDYGIAYKTYFGRLVLRFIKKISPSPVPGWYDTHAKHNSVY